MSRRRDRGSALPLVLWVLAVLFIISMSFSFLIQSRIRRMEMLFNRFQARLEAYSAVQYGLVLFLTGICVGPELRAANFANLADGNRYFLDGTPAAVPLFGNKPRLSFQEEAGLVNLRLFALDPLAGLMKYFGASDDVQRVVIDSLLDWTDADDLIRLNGAEKDYYAPLGYRPRNAALLTLDEILMIRGMDESLYTKIRPFLSLGSAQGINPNTAPFEVLMSLPNMTADAARRVIDVRKTGPFTNLASFSVVCGINYAFYERLFSFVSGAMLIIQGSSPFGENSAYVIICQIQKRSGAALGGGLAGERADPLTDESGRWLPFEIVFWQEKVR